MRLLRVTAVVLALWWAASCSSTNNTSSTLLPTRTSNQTFAVSTEQGQGNFNPAMSVKTTPTGAVVTIEAQQATDLSAAFVHLQYDASKYTPTGVEFGSFLGAPQQVISLALTNQPGEAQLGVVQIGNSGVYPKNGNGSFATVNFDAKPFLAARATSKAPSDTMAQVTDLSIIDQTSTTVTLKWKERNPGDYNEDSLVSISDLTPLGPYFGQKVIDAADPVAAGIADGNGDGFVNISDLTPIGSHLGNQLSGYVLYTNDNGTAEANQVPRPTGIDTHKPVYYQFVAGYTGTEKYSVKPMGSSHTDVGPQSNIAQITIVPGKPDAPTGVTVTGNQGIGSLKLQVNWTKSVAADVVGYKVERKLDTDPDGSYAQVGPAPLPGTSYTDSTGLTDADYTYRVFAIDNEPTPLTSDPSTPATGHPYVQVISPPINVTAAAATDGTPSAIHIDWDAPADGSAERYTVYKQAPGDPGFTAVFTSLNSAISDYTDTGLTVAQDYNYYITSRDLFLTAESVPSATKSAQCSAAVVLAVTDLTTDKSTHLKTGAEGVANLTAPANATPDSWT